MATSNSPTRYVGPSPTGGYYYANPTTGDIIDSSNAPSPEQIQSFQAENPGAGTTAQTQATPAQVDQTIGGTVPVYTQDQVNRSLSSQDDGAVAYTNPGVGAGTSPNSFDARGNDNTPPASTSATQQTINQNFANQKIVSQPNVLDQYASYTYAISWWLLTPDQYNNLTTGAAPAPGTGNWSLLIQDGGAPTSGRNQYFPYDYYLDDLEIETFLMGKGTSMSTNGMEIKFKVVEPNGITLLQNLYSAVVAAYKNTSTTGQAPNYGAAQYCLTIEFYGYDSNGNLVAPATGQYTASGQLSSTNSQSIIKKYYPFLIENITFRTVANQIEYNVVGKAVPYSTGTSQARGTIPYAFELSGQTVSQLLQGSAGSGASAANGNDGRTSSPSPQTALSPVQIDSAETAALFNDGTGYTPGYDPNAGWSA